MMGYYRNLEPLKRLQQASPYWKNAWPPKELELLKRLEPLEQAPLRCVQSDGGARSAGQTENLSDNPRRFYAI